MNDIEKLFTIEEVYKAIKADADYYEKTNGAVSTPRSVKIPAQWSKINL